MTSGPDTTGEVITDRPGRRVTLLADTRELALTEFEYGPGEQGASPHIHADHSDAFLVLEGELEITFETGPLRAPADVQWAVEKAGGSTAGGVCLRPSQA